MTSLQDGKSRATPARRGDLIVIHTVETSGSLRPGVSRCDRYTLGVVTNITRDGLVTKYRAVGKAGFQRVDLIEWKLRGIKVAPQALWDVEGAMAAAAAHTYPGSATPMPWDSLDALIAAVARFRKPVTP